MSDNIKSEHAALLNRLSDMQESLAYAVARPTLAQAENLIVAQESEITRLRAELAALRCGAEHKCWLIENHVTPKPLWYCGESMLTDDASMAVRFPTKEAAEAVFELLRYGPEKNTKQIYRAALSEDEDRHLKGPLDWYRITEHIFDYTHPPQPRKVRRLAGEEVATLLGGMSPKHLRLAPLVHATESKLAAKWGLELEG